MNDHIATIERMLSEARDAADALQAARAAADVEMEAVKVKHATLVQQCGDRVEQIAKSIKSYAKTHRAELFDGKDRVDLRHGALLHVVRSVVRRSRKVTVEILEWLGFQDGVRVEKKVDWDVVEKWPNERLLAVGTERVTQEMFDFEINGR